MPTRSRRSKVAEVDAWMRLDNQLCFALYSTSLAMTKLYKGTLATLGLTYPQYLVLLALWEQDALSVGELGDRLCLDSGTLTPLLKRMAAAGLLCRERAGNDERRVVVSLTDAGRALRSQGRGVPREVSAATGLGFDEVRALTQQLQRLRDRLQAATGAIHFPPAAARKAAAISPAPNPTN